LSAAPLRRLSLLMNSTSPCPRGGLVGADAADVARVVAGGLQRRRHLFEHDAGGGCQDLARPLGRDVVANSAWIDSEWPVKTERARTCRRREGRAARGSCGSRCGASSPRRSRCRRRRRGCRRTGSRRTRWARRTSPAAGSRRPSRRARGRACVPGRARPRPGRAAPAPGEPEPDTAW
jgi:hypothetical protein